MDHEVRAYTPEENARDAARYRSLRNTLLLGNDSAGELFDAAGRKAGIPEDAEKPTAEQFDVMCDNLP